MSFDGRDYHNQWKEAVSELRYTRDAEVIDGHLRHVEWILWEAIRGVFFTFSVLVGFIFVAIPAWLIGVSDADLIVKVTAGVFVLLIAISFYWVLRFIFWYEISRHVKGRKFGGSA